MTEGLYLSRAKLSTRLAFVAAGFGVACCAPLVPFAKTRCRLGDDTMGLVQTRLWEQTKRQLPHRRQSGNAPPPNRGIRSNPLRAMLPLSFAYDCSLLDRFHKAEPMSRAAFLDGKAAPGLSRPDPPIVKTVRAFLLPVPT